MTAASTIAKTKQLIAVGKLTETKEELLAEGWRVRHRAASAMREVGDATVLEELKAALASEKMRYVKVSLDIAIKSISGR